MGTFQIEEEEGRVIAAYLELSDKPVARSVEVERNKIIVDEADDGTIVGVEFIQPSSIRSDVRRVAEVYNSPDIERHLKDILSAC